MSSFQKNPSPPRSFRFSDNSKERRQKAMLISSAFDTEPSAGHCDVVWEKMSRRVGGSRLMGGQMHYKSHNDMERVFEANGMIK